MAGFENDIVYAKNADFTQADNQAPAEANGLFRDKQVWVGSTLANAGGTHVNVLTLTEGSGITITQAATTLTIAAPGSTTDYHVARYIVSAGGSTDGANYTTIAAAYAAAVGAGGVQTVFVQPGTYTENLTLSADVNICAFDCDPQTPNVTIVGTITASYSGSASISGIRIKASSGQGLVVSGSNATVLTLTNCFYQSNTINDGIIYSVSNSSSRLNLLYCNGDITVAGGTYLGNSSSGIATFAFCNFQNSASSSGVINATTGSTTILEYCILRVGLQWLLTSTSTTRFCDISVSSGTGVAITGTGTHTLENCRISSGSSVAVSIGTGCTCNVNNCVVDSTNTNAISGAGTLVYSEIAFSNTSSTIQGTLTQTKRNVAAGSLTAASTFNVASTGIMTNTTQPIFSAKLASTTANVTGDGTLYTIILDSELYDVGGNFNLGTSTFTAPVTGKYMFVATYGFENVGAAHTTLVTYIVATGITINTYTVNPAAMVSVSTIPGYVVLSGTGIIAMTAGDTCVFKTAIYGGTKTVSMSGGGNTIVSGFLLC